MRLTPVDHGNTEGLTMTEAEWLASTDPAALLREALKWDGEESSTFRRKRRLLAAAFCRGVGGADHLVAEFEADIPPRDLRQWFEGWWRTPGLSGSAQASLVRDIFGNPFRPVQLNCTRCFGGPCDSLCPERPLSRFITETTTRIAQAIYDNRDWDAMPALADALEEAGCKEEAILRHLRCEEEIPDGIQPRDWMKLRAPHVRGCWVIDLLTGRE